MKKIFLLIPVFLLLTGCVIDGPIIDGEGYLSKDVEIRLSMGSGSAPATRAESTDVTINNVAILVFDNTDTTDPKDAKFLYSRYAWQKSGNIYNSILRIADNLDIYFMINSNNALNNAGLTEGMTWNTVQSKLIMENPDQIDRAADGLPMWGYRLDVEIKEGIENNLGIVKLLRSVASTDVEITADNFTLEAGHIVFGSTKGNMAFTVDADNIEFEDENDNIKHPQSDFKLIKPEIPASTVTTAEWRYPLTGVLEDVVGATPNEIKNIFYFYENEGPTSSAPEKRYTKLILEGVWDDPGTTSDITSFYPIAFRDTLNNSSGSNDRLEVIRNRKFVIIITNVNGNGYTDLDDAKKGEDLNMEYQIIPWEEWGDGDIYVDGSKYISLGVDRNQGLMKTASLYRNATSTDIITFVTNIGLDQFDLALTEDGGDVVKMPLTAEETAAGVITKIENDFYEVKLIDDTDKEITYFLFTAKQDYADTNPVSVLTVTSGRIEFDINIEQRNAEPEDWQDGGNQKNDLGSY